MTESIRIFDILFVKCGWIGYALWLLSFVTVGVMVRFFLMTRRGKAIPRDVLSQMRSLLRSEDYRRALELSGKDPSFLSGLVHSGLAEAPHGYEAMERAMEEAAEQRTISLLRQVEYLNLIGNVSPMLGLTGTVWGMILAFFTIVETGGTPNPAKLAGAIGIALVTTLLCLGVAIPSLSVYALLRNRIDSLASEAMVLSQELLSSVKIDRAD